MCLSGESIKVLRKLLFFFSGKGSSRQEVFVGEEERLWEGCTRHTDKLYSYSRKAPNQEVRDRVAPDKPTGNSVPMGKQARLSGLGWGGSSRGSTVTLHSINLLLYLVFLCAPNTR